MLVVLAAACTACEGPGASEQPARRQPALSVTTAAPTDEITLSGRVTAAYGPHLFVVGSGAERVVVVTRMPVAVLVGSEVDVTGHARTFRRHELEVELGVALGAEADGLENGTCLVASIARLR